MRCFTNHCQKSKWIFKVVQDIEDHLQVKMQWSQQLKLLITFTQNSCQRIISFSKNN